MTRILLVSLLGLLALCQPLLAQDEPRSDPEPPLLGMAHFACQFDYMFMQHRTFAFDDFGIHLGIKGYGHLGDDWYLGGEIGAGGAVGFIFGPTSDIGTIELNAKRAFSISSLLVMDLGGGVSLNSVDITDWSLFSDDTVKVEDWVLGMQALADIYFRFEWGLAGLSVKYMLTTDVSGYEEIDPGDPDYDMSSLMIGAQVGFLIK
jgi:hypothetical protein